jgi:hypothetical protein
VPSVSMPSLVTSTSFEPSFDEVAFFARPRAGGDFTAAPLLEEGAFFALSAPDLTGFAGALLARVAVLVARLAVVEPLADLAAVRFAPALAVGLAAVRFAGSSVAGLALLAAT